MLATPATTKRVLAAQQLLLNDDLLPNIQQSVFLLTLLE